MEYEEIISEVSRELGLPKAFVDKTYKTFWKAVRLYIKEQPLKDNLTDEEFLKLRPNVNIPSIGKFYITPEKYRRIKKKNEILINKKYAKDKIN